MNWVVSFADLAPFVHEEIRWILLTIMVKVSDVQANSMASMGQGCLWLHFSYYIDIF